MSQHLKTPQLEIPTLVELVQRRAAQLGDKRAYTFLTDGETTELHLTYRELDRRAAGIAMLLRNAGLAGERILLLYPSGLDFIVAFFGCLYAQAIAVPVAVPHIGHHSMRRLQAIVTDALPKAALTTERVYASLERQFTNAPELCKLRWIATDGEDEDIEAGYQVERVTGETLAYLQYTSGSTATPRGVMLNHATVLYNLSALWERFAPTPDDVAVSWSPFYHDMGLVGNVLLPIYSRVSLVFMTPTAFLQRPVRWLRAITRTGATICGGPNFAYELCARQISAQQRADLDLHSWRVVYSGAEPVRSETLERFAQTFAECGFQRRAFYPCYGLAEATLLVSCAKERSNPIVRTFKRTSLEHGEVIEAIERDEHSRELISCGQVVPGSEIVIAHPDSKTRCSPGQMGEIWVAGPGVAQGYWNHPQETEYTFHAQLVDEPGMGPFLRTGDLGFIIGDELFIAGRQKDMLIIHGRNHYPQDIEATVEQCHSALQPGGCAAFSIEVESEEWLVVVQEVTRQHRDADGQQIIAALLQAIADEHDLQPFALALVRPGSIPRTSSGKIQHFACKERWLKGELEILWHWRKDAQSRTLQDSTDKTGELQPTRSPEISLSQEDMEAQLIELLGEQLGISAHEIDVRTALSYYGLDSLAAARIASALEGRLGRSLSPTLVYEYPTIKALARYIVGEARDETEAPRTHPQNPHQGEGNEPIAIIGIGCRFPGAHGLEAFWQLLCEGTDAIIEVPQERMEYYARISENTGESIPRWGGFLEQIDRFDAHIFRIAPREAERIDPQQRLLLEVAWEALENAGQPIERLAGTQTGVFIGIASSDYGLLQLRSSHPGNAYAGTGSALSIAANRISYVFDLHGPSLAVDTACSSSLVAIHLACRSLRNRECSMALAGGVNIILSPAITAHFAQAGLLAPDGHCKTFDAQADGFVRGEGAGIVVLKHLSQALDDHDPIYAVIRGSAVNQDGHSNGLMAPSRQAQESVLRQAYHHAGIPPGQAQYVEAHGTGTLLGDSIEMKALGSVLASDRQPEQRCAVGSVKTNIGHLEAAAGIAGLIKVALALKHRMLPPSLHFRVPNPHIPFDELPLYVQTTLDPLPQWQNGFIPTVAGVSSFGFGGTNVHVVLQEYSTTAQLAEERTQAKSSLDSYKNHTGETLLLPLSAHSPAALQAMAQSYEKFFKPEATGTEEDTLRDCCYTAAVRRSHHHYRSAFVFSQRAELHGQLQAFIQNRPCAGVFNNDGGQEKPYRLVFVFSGIGGQWLGMGRELLAKESVFRDMIQRCDKLIRTHTHWSLLEKLTTEGENVWLEEVDVVQPTLFALQVGLATLWQAWGLRPQAVVGHSMGEVAAAYVAGALSLEEAVRVICQRSLLLQRVSGQGAMVAVELAPEQAQAALAGYEERVVVAARNGPTSCVLSGEPAALERITAMQERRGIACRKVKTDVASHSPQVAELSSALFYALEGMRTGPASITMYSTVGASAGKFDANQPLDAAYWARNMREPVDFMLAVQQLLDDGFNTFLEIGPHPVLLPAINQSLQYHNQPCVLLASLRRNMGEQRTMRETLGMLYTQGWAIDWSALYATGSRCVALPSYAWQRERYWLPDIELESGTAQIVPQRRSAIQQHQQEQHPLLLHYMHLAHPVEYHAWEVELDPAELAYLEDHQILGERVMPGVAFVEMALAAATSITDGRPCALTEVTFVRLLTFPERSSRIVQIVISSANGGEASFSISSRLAGAAASQQAGTLHVTGKIDYHQSLVPPVEHSAPCDVQARCSQELAGETYYRHLRERGYQYGRAMKHIKHIWSKQGEILALLHFEATEIAGAYLIHPTILEAGAQALLAGLPMEEGAGNVYVPVSINRVVYHRRALSDSLWSHVRLQETTGIGAPVLEGDMYLLDDTGNVLVEAQGVRFQHLERGGSRGIPAEAAQWLYVLQWREQTLPRNPISDRQLARSADTWIVLGDDCEMSTELAASVRTRGERCTQIITGEIYNYLDDDHICIHPDELGHFERALTDIFAKAHTDTLNIVCLGSADAKPLQVSTWNPLELALSSGCIGILYLIQALDRYHRSMKLRVWLVTHGAQDAGGEGCRTEAALTQAPLWGLGRTLLHEYPHLSCTLVDIDNVGTQRAVEALLHEFAIGDAERQVVLRANRRYLARLAHYALPNLPSSFEPLGTGTTLLLFHQDATYLVTGGLGGIGLVLTRWLIEQGARHVTLLGRHAPSQAVQVMLNDLMQATGAHITVLQADVAKTEDVVNALMHITHPPLRGVFHLAGTLDDGLLTHLDRQRFQTVMAPKVQGAWNLHAHTLDMPLDYFVLFSSAAAMPGSPGQGNYAAANAFLDTLAHFRRKLGLPALSINWGPWSEIGLAAQGERGKRLVLRGIESLTPTQGLRLLERMLYAIRSDQAQVPAQVGVLPIASDQLNRIAATAAMNALFSEIQGSRSGSRSVEGMRIRSGGLRPTLLEMESEQCRSTLEQYLREQVARVLRNSSTMLNVYEPLTSFGLDSLMTMELKNQLEEDLELGIPIAMLLQDPSIRELTTHLLEQLAGGDDSDPTADLPLPPIESVTATGEYTGQRYPLSYAQERMWFFEKAAPGSTGPGDNLPVGARLIGPLHPEALLQSFEELVRRHNVLRTSFVTHQGRPLQAIRPYQVKEQTQEMHTSSNLALSLFDLTKWSRAEQEAEVTRLFREEQYFTFDLESDALLRVKLIRLAEKEWILLLNMHHIISDAWSLGILMSELGMLYVALSQGEPSPLPPLSIQYADYAVWQHRWLRGAILERQLAYWSTQLAEAPTLLPLPTDYKRPPVRSYAGACFSFTLSEDVSKGVIALSRSEGVTLFMTLLAAFTLLLHHYGGQEDIVIGSITAGRVRAEIEGLIGLFTNLVALRIQIKDGNITFRELLQHVQAVTLDGYAHQDVPLQTVVEHLGIIQDTSYTTLFQVMFVLQNTPLSNGITQLGDLEIQPLGSEWVQWEAELAPCDLELHMFESEEGILRGNLYYSTELFKRTTIERLMAWFQDILKRIGVDSKRRVNEFIFQVSEEQTPP